MCASCRWSAARCPRTSAVLPFVLRSSRPGQAMAERSPLLRSAGVAALCLALAACNASGRPRNVAAPKPAPAVVAAAPVNAAEFGKTIGSDYVVAPGDTLAVVADRTNTSIRSLIDMNNLQPPYALAPGMRLALQPRSQYVVQQGDTLSSLAQRY